MKLDQNGLQSQKAPDLEQRKSLVDALVRSGLKNIEIGSFVSPKAVPQMAGTSERFNHCLGLTI